MAALRTRVDSLDDNMRKQFEQVFEAILGLSGPAGDRTLLGGLSVKTRISGAVLDIVQLSFRLLAFLPASAPVT